MYEVLLDFFFSHHYIVVVHSLSTNFSVAKCFFKASCSVLDLRERRKLRREVFLCDEGRCAW